MEDGDAIFEVYHKNLSENVREESEKAVLLGTCAIPLRDVLFEKQGITGWFNIYNDEKVVGSINLEIVLDEYSRRDLLRKSKDSFEYSPRTELDENPSLYKFTITVEEAFIPYEALLNITPHYIRAKRHSFVCQYFVSYRFYGAGRKISTKFLTMLKEELIAGCIVYQIQQREYNYGLRKNSK